MFFYVAAQLNAAGAALEAVFSWPYWVGVLLGAAVTIFYTTIGGYRAVCWTDLFQGLLMVAALVVLPLIAYFASAAWTAAARRSTAREGAALPRVQGLRRRRATGSCGSSTADPAMSSRPGPPARTLTLSAEERGEVTIFRSVDGGAATEISAADGEPADARPLADRPRRERRRREALRPRGRRRVLRADRRDGRGSCSSAGSSRCSGSASGIPAVAARRRPLHGGEVEAGDRPRDARSPSPGRVLAEGGAITMGILARGLFPDLADPQAGLLEGRAPSCIRCSSA